MADNFDTSRLEELFQRQRAFFLEGKTKDIAFRKRQLKSLRATLKEHERELSDALWMDLHKCYQEAFLTEFSVIYHEISYHLRHLKEWCKPKRVGTPLTLFPASSQIVAEPMGTSLIIAPWNYPVQLLILPLVGAISAGCTALLKPSPYTANVSASIKSIIEKTFSEDYIAVVEGHRDVNTQLLEMPFDVIFFTGSPALGRVVMQKASKHLSRVILELGGKSPCIVDEGASVTIAARRIAWGKVLNAGQTCVAPDYILLHKEIRDKFLDALKEEIEALIGDSPASSTLYTHIVSPSAVQRLEGYLDCGKVTYGGTSDKEARFFAPTIIEEPEADSKLMNEEIFGPVLPIIGFEHIENVIRELNLKPKPLALYYFGKRNAQKVIGSVSSGGVCINDTIMHVASTKLPFGGVGNSGMGRYHGKESFLSFSHQKSILRNSTILDIPFRYMPYRFFRLIRHMIK